MPSPAPLHDWNAVNGPGGPAPELMDETLRDGLQSPSVRDPPLEQKQALVVAMADIGVRAVDLGLPAAGPRQRADVAALLRFLGERRLPLQACAAARTLVRDLEPLADLQQRSGVPVLVYAFIGASPARQQAEGWDLDRVLRAVEETAGWARSHGVHVALVTEDTPRTAPATLERLVRAAGELGCTRLVLSDTVGHATPEGVRALVAWTRALLSRLGTPLPLDWHGHNDRGLALANTLAALDAGADRLHATALGVGERVGNAAMEQVLANLRLMGRFPGSLTPLTRYCALAAQALDVPIAPAAPVVGRDAFRTATGVHAAAVAKAEWRGDPELADRVYGSLPAAAVGRHQEVEIGPMSGAWNVRHWMRAHGQPDDEAACHAVLREAKQHDRVLDADEVWRALGRKPAG